MSQAHVLFDQVWKKFRRGNVHDSLRDLIPAAVRSFTNRRAPNEALREKEFWAVRDLSFQVSPGEILGIIGHNGAGKSTVLKLLNRILEPTHGEARIVGRVGALIEVSAGFHPDLTGRQNVYLQGAIMGMKKVQVERQFDSIVDFSGIASFIDTPVKRYSSGMNARLGFAIAVHLEPEVLLIDEVLSVGDRDFQQRAYGAIRNLAFSGVPVVIVSHQLDRIVEMCTSAILLERGVATVQGTPAECVGAYVNAASRVQVSPDEDDAPISVIELASINGHTFAPGARIELRAVGRVNEAVELHEIAFAVRVINQQTGEQVYMITHSARGVNLPEVGECVHDVSLSLNVAPGTYNLEFCVWDLRQWQIRGHPVAIAAEVVARDLFWGPVDFQGTWRLASESRTATVGQRVGGDTE